jgi:hypothetical protein
MSSRKVFAPVLILALFLGTSSSLYAQAPWMQGHRGNNETSIPREISSRTLLQSIMDFLRAIVASDSGSPGQQSSNGNGNGSDGTNREGAGLCPNGQPCGQHPGNGNNN